MRWSECLSRALETVEKRRRSRKERWKGRRETHRGAHVLHGSQTKECYDSHLTFICFFYQLFKQMIFLELLCSGVMKAGSLEDHSFSHFQAHSALEDNFHISFKWTSMESWSCVSVSAEMVWKTHITASATSAPSYLHGENLCKDDWPSWMPPSQTRFSSSFKSQLLRRLEASFPTLGD